MLLLRLLLLLLLLVVVVVLLLLLARPVLLARTACATPQPAAHGLRCCRPVRGPKIAAAARAHGNAGSGGSGGGGGRRGSSQHVALCIRR